MGETYHKLRENAESNSDVGVVNETHTQQQSSHLQQQQPSSNNNNATRGLYYPNQPQQQQQQPPQNLYPIQPQPQQQPPQFVPHHLPPHFQPYANRQQQQQQQFHQQQQYHHHQQPGSQPQQQQPQQEQPQRQQQNEDTQESQPQSQQQQQQEFAPIFPNETPWIQPNKVDPILAALLSFFIFPGLGQILVGQNRKGVWLGIISLIIGIIISFLCMIYVGFLLFPIFFVWAICVSIDAYRIAKRVQDGYPVYHGECSNSIAKLGLTMFMKEPVFNNSVFSECPAEWNAAIQQVEQARYARNQV